MRGKSPVRDRRHDPQPHAQGRARPAAEGRRRGRAWRSSRPIHFCSFPSILKGWIDRVFTLDFAFGLTSEGWHGDINGRIPLLHHQRALIMTSTIFDKNAYDDGIRDAIAKVIDDWGFRYPGIDDVEHVYFYAATAAPPETIHAYLDQAYQLGKDFGLPREAPATSTTNRTGGVMRPLPIVWQRLVSRGQTCDRCAATQHEVEHAVHILARRSDRSASSHNSRSASSTRPRSNRTRPHRTASGSPASRWRTGSAAPLEAAAAAPCAATPNAAPSKSAAPPTRPFRNDSSSRPRSSRHQSSSTSPRRCRPNIESAEPITPSTLANSARH